MPSLAHICDDLNPGVYTSSYKQRIKELSGQINITFQNEERNVQISNLVSKSVVAT